MKLKALCAATSDFSQVLETEQDLQSLLAKWLDKQLKSTSLDTLKLMARAHGDNELVTLLENAGEPAVRAVAKRVDANNRSLAPVSKSELVNHLVELAAGRVVPVAKIKASSKPKPPKPMRPAGNLLERSKY